MHPRSTNASVPESRVLSETRSWPYCVGLLAFVVAAFGLHSSRAAAESAAPAPPAKAASPSSATRPAAGREVDFTNLDIEGVIRIFGEPTKYTWQNKTFSKAELPSHYVAVYPKGLSILMGGNRIIEFRHEEPGPIFGQKLQVGSKREEVIKELGEPKRTVQGKSCDWQEGTLYLDIDGQKGRGYYERKDKGVRLFLFNDRVAALYVYPASYKVKGHVQTREAPDGREQPGGKPGTGRGDGDNMRDASGLPFVVWASGQGLSGEDFSKYKKLPAAYAFDPYTVWPETSRMPPGCDPKRMLEEAKNPGLGVRELHKQGITGKGVSVAIIDQPLLKNHPEYKGKIAGYKDVGCESEVSMHGPAVASLLVGTNCGTAPDAKLYYVAAPSWSADAEYYAKGLEWLIEQNEKLSSGEKIRVLSVSASPSGPGSPFTKGGDAWDRAVARAKKAGIMLLDCSTTYGFIGACWYDADDPENLAKCLPGFPEVPGVSFPGRLLVPASPRTVAEQHLGRDTYMYCGRGGLSWSIPYCAGVLAMGWQVRPDLSPEQMKELLFKSAYELPSGHKMIDPKAFVEQVKAAKRIAGQPGQ